MALFIQQSGTICAILVEGILRNNFMKLFKFEPADQEKMLFKDFLSRLLAALVFCGS